MSSTVQSIPDGCTGELDADELVHNAETCQRHENVPHRIATFAANLARQHGWPVEELLRSAITCAAGYVPEEASDLHVYLVRSENGVRGWHAEDAAHAREQHTEAFGDEPGETVLGVRKANGLS